LERSFRKTFVEKVSSHENRHDSALLVLKEDSAVTMCELSQRSDGRTMLLPKHKKRGRPISSGMFPNPSQRSQDRPMNHRFLMPIWFALTLLQGAAADELSHIAVAPDGRGFVQVATGEPFVPWGFNYDHDRDGRLLEDYWETDWNAVEADFAEMKQLGANVVRIHLQLGRFLKTADQTNDAALARLSQLIALAERLGLYLDLTGLGCYHQADVPAWYDALDEPARWNAQCRFWQAVARCGASSPAIFCYDLMNEPVVPGAQRAAGDWLGPPFAGKHFVQFITLDPGERPRYEIARQWIEQLTAAVRQEDPHHLVTVGLVDWSLDRPGLTSGFVPDKVTAPLDFIAVHLYPEAMKLDKARATLRGFQIGKPLLVEETFPLKCSTRDLAALIEQQPPVAAGWISFYWGQTPAELRPPRDIPQAMLLEWLTWFEQHASMPPSANER
jgi:hypothetical protein